MKRIGLVTLLLIVLGGGFFVVKTLGHPASQTVVASIQKGAMVSEKTNVPSVSGLSGLTLASVSGKSIAIDPNKKTVLHFMISSCETCVATETELTKFAHMSGVQIVSIDVDPQNDNLSTIQAFEQVTKASWPYIMDTNQSLVKKFNVTELDTVVVLYNNQVILDQVAPSPSILKRVLA